MSPDGTDRLHEGPPALTRTSTTPSLPASDLTERQRARRDRIVDAALALARGRSVVQIQVKDVAESAGVALGTVYHYFSSKDHLFAEALVRWASALRGNVTRHPLVGATTLWFVFPPTVAGAGLSTPVLKVVQH